MRIIVPLVVALAGAMVVVSLMQPADKTKQADADAAQRPEAQTPPPAGDTDKPDAGGEPGNKPEPADPVVADSEGGPDAQPDAQPDAEPDSAPASDNALENLRPDFPETVAALDEPSDLITLGSLNPADGYALSARINPYRAAIYDLTFVNEYHNVNQKEQYKLLNPISFDLFDEDGNKTTNYPEAGSYGAKKITINGQPVPLANYDKDSGDWLGHWDAKKISDSKIKLTLKIVAGPEDAPVDVALVSRTYSVRKADQLGSHTVELTQQVENLTGKPMTIQWEQLAQGGVYHASNDYLRGRSNQYVLGHFDLEYDQEKFSIYVGNDAFLPEPDLIRKLKNPNKPGKNWKSAWPNPRIDNPEQKELAWLASENRYFVAISSPQVKITDDIETGDIPALQAIYPTVTTTIYPNTLEDPDLPDEKRRVILGLISDAITLAPGEKSSTNQLSLDLFAGPREDEILAQQPYQAMHYEKTIRYSLGGMCGFCTFQWLAHLLLSFLELLHLVVFDWGIAIVILVLVVRLCLHPLTKRGQTSMMMMGKQMAAVQPELDKLKKKYADDPRQMQQAQMQLFREKGINPAAGALGCLPMFVQMPIWIALYATLYYAIELRHVPAFYGVFQNFGGWEFLADLSSADRFIPLFANDGTHIFQLIFIRLDYSSINLLPILMGITFFINMKYTTPPPMNEQQATQQKIMKIMPLLFPFFLYSAPAGLTLYICASTLAGIVDSRIVRNHVKQMEESGELFKPKQRKPGGIMDKLQKAAEMQAAKAEDLKKQQGKNKGTQNKKKRKR